MVRVLFRRPPGPNRTGGRVGRQRGAKMALFRRPPSEPDLPVFRASRLSSAHRGCRGGLPLWMPSWHARQTTRVLRWRAAIRLTHSGGLPRPLRLRSLSARMWCTSTCFRDPQSSHSSARSRWTISDRCAPDAGGVVVEGPAVVSRAREMPPHCATNGGFPSRSTVTCRPWRGRARCRGWRGSGGRPAGR